MEARGQKCLSPEQFILLYNLLYMSCFIGLKPSWDLLTAYSMQDFKDPFLT